MKAKDVVISINLIFSRSSHSFVIRLGYITPNVDLVHLVQNNSNVLKAILLSSPKHLKTLGG